MPKLHIVQGDADKDRMWLEKAARKNLRAPSWTVPKTVTIGDEVVIYIAGYGFYATARINSPSEPRSGWWRRYGASLNSIKLILPSILLTTIQRQIPSLTWANYPRSITTPSPEIADRIRKLIRNCRKTGIPGEEDLAAATIDELRNAALRKARQFATPKERRTIYRLRSLAIRLYVLRRANGSCEACEAPAPFRKPDGSDYLEPHHTTRLSDEGPDHPAKVIALCPNCHRKAHYADDSDVFNARLIKKMRTLEPR